MEQVINNSVNVSKKIISTEKRRERKNINKIVKKISIQIIICCILITSIYLFKVFNTNSFEYINNKYSWVIRYNMTYTDTYNSIATYLNNTFQFKIPLKEEKQDIENSVAIDNKEVDLNIENSNNINLDENIQLEDIAVLGVAYDNMRIMADEVKNKNNWTLPTSGKITSPFGVRDPSRPDISSFHMGIDVANAEGTEIISAIDGEIIEATYNNIYGNYIKVVKDDVMTLYAHCSKLLVKQGDIVKSGDKIALMGTTGISTGPHLHFEIRKNNEVINPEYILNFR